MNPAHSGGIVVESYKSVRPADATAVLAPLLDELARSGFVAGDAVARAFEAAESRPALATIGATELTRTGVSLASIGLPASFTADAERARIAWLRGEIDRALALATPLVDAARANPGVFVLDPAQREPLRTALITIGLARRHSRDFAGMREAFGELASAFPGELLGAEYGPEANRAYEAVRNELAARTGTLTVHAPDYTKGVYIDGRLGGTGAISRIEAIPGEHRVIVRGDYWLSRSYRVIVRPAEHTVVSIDRVFDNAVYTGPGWAGLMFNTLEHYEDMEGKLAADIARTIGAQDVVVVGIGSRFGASRRVAVAARINPVNGEYVRLATVELDRDSSVEHLRSLARYVAGEPASAGVSDWSPHHRNPWLLGGRPTGNDDIWAVPRSLYGPRWWTGWRWVTGGAAIAALGTSTTLIILDDTFKNSDSAFWLMTGGTLLTGATLYLGTFNSLVKVSPRSSYLVPLRGGAFAGVTAQF